MYKNTMDIGSLYILLDRIAFTALIVFWTGSVAAQEQAIEFNQLVEQCSQIRNSAEDGFQGRALARPLADKLETLAQSANENDALVTLLSVMNEEAADCVAYARQIPAGVVFDPNRNRFVSAGTVRAQEEAIRRVEEEERAALAEAEAAIQERIRQDRQQALESEVNSRVFEACRDLALNDSIAAYTNALCVQSFRANGLPEQ